LRTAAAPRLDEDGYGLWHDAVAEVCGFLRVYRRDVQMVASVPLPLSDEPRIVATPDGDGPGPASAFVQMVWPWVTTSGGADLPEGLEPPEGLFAGALARNALERGTYRSVAGTRLPTVIREFPALDRDTTPDSPTTRLARGVCLIGPEPDGMTILSDVTASSDEAWRLGGVSRLLATLLRVARRVGEAESFAPNGPALWTRLRRGMESVLEDHYQAGALRGTTSADAFTVRCGRDTTPQNDLDAGRVRVEVSVQPAVSIERIVVVLDLAPGGVDVRTVGMA
jgi:phage tail sheath protein FI